MKLIILNNKNKLEIDEASSESGVIFENKKSSMTFKIQVILYSNIGIKSKLLPVLFLHCPLSVTLIKRRSEYVQQNLQEYSLKFIELIEFTGETLKSHFHMSVLL